MRLLSAVERWEDVSLSLKFPEDFLSEWFLSVLTQAAANCC